MLCRMPFTVTASHVDLNADVPRTPFSLARCQSSVRACRGAKLCRSTIVVLLGARYQLHGMPAHVPGFTLPPPFPYLLRVERMTH